MDGEDFFVEEEREEEEEGSKEVEVEEVEDVAPLSLDVLVVIQEVPPNPLANPKSQTLTLKLSSIKTL